MKAPSPEKGKFDEFRAVHKEDKRTIMRNYTNALRAQGWKLSKFDESGDRFYLDMKKGAEEIHLEFYDFDNTGVVMEKRRTRHFALRNFVKERK